jgi:hypothetical protein
VPAGGGTGAGGGGGAATVATKKPKRPRTPAVAKGELAHAAAGAASALNDSEISRSFRAYTSDSVYGQINDALRTGKAFRPGSFEHQVVVGMDNGFAKATPLGMAIEVKRRINIGRMQEERKNVFGNPGQALGKTFTDRGMMSTSSKEVIEPYHGKNTAEITLHVPAGQKALSVQDISHYGKDEAEIVLPRGTSFKVTSDTVDSRGVRRMTATVVRQQTTPLPIAGATR